MSESVLTPPPDVLALGFAHPDALANDEDPPVLELLRHALDADDEMFYDTTRALLLGLRREVFILEAATPHLCENDIQMALHCAWRKLGVAIHFHTRQIEALRSAVAARVTAAPPPARRDGGPPQAA
jgi:hypothetical protein